MSEKRPHFRIFMSKIQLDFGILPLILFHIQNFNYIKIAHLKVTCHQLTAVNSAATCFFSQKEMTGKLSVAQYPISEIFLLENSIQRRG